MVGMTKMSRNMTDSMGSSADCPLLWSLGEVARQLGGVSVRTVRRMIERGELPAFHLGRLVRVPADAVRSWVAQKSQQAHNSNCAELVAWKGVEPCHTSERTAQTGGRPISTQAANELDVLLAQLTERKRKPSKQSGSRRLTK